MVKTFERNKKTRKKQKKKNIYRMKKKGKMHANYCKELT